MRESVRPAATVAALVAMMALLACRERESLGGSGPGVALADESVAVCGGDSLRPATAAPAPGLWLYELPPGRRVAAMIGPMRPVGRELAMTRSVETVETSAAGDTTRHRAAAVVVSLELLPPLGAMASANGVAADSVAVRRPAATYALSARVWLAAYEPCAPGRGGPRIRYLRRDAAGRVVTDVLLHRTSE